MLVIVHKLLETSALLLLSVLETAGRVMCVAADCLVAIQIKLSRRQAGCSCVRVDGPGSIFGPLAGGALCGAEMNGGTAPGGAGQGLSLRYRSQAAPLCPWDQPCGSAT